MPEKKKASSSIKEVGKDKNQVTTELTKTKAKKSLIVNYGTVDEKKNILNQIKNNYPTAKVNKLKESFSAESIYQFNLLVELDDYKVAKEAKETLAKKFKGKAVSVETALTQKKKIQSSIRKTDPYAPPENNKEVAVPNGQMGDRSRGLFEIRIPKIIIRNLNFNIKEELLRKEMEKFGPVTLINLPKKDDGKPKGFGFITFDKLNDAKKCINDLNAKTDKFMGTKVACDWCIPKNIFVKNTEEAKEQVKADSDQNDYLSDDNDNDIDADKDNDSSEEINKDSADEEKGDDDDSEGDDNKDSEDEEEKPKKKKAEKRKADPVNEKFAKKRFTGTQDVQEQRTVFIRNLSYDTTEEAVMESFSTFGPIKYVKLVMDKDLERPKGTAFVCFEKAEGANEAASKSEVFEVESRKIQIDLAVSRSKAYDIVQDRKAAEHEPKDNRNLALAKEGVIYANSYESKEVSKADMLRRQKLEESNRLKLQILHYFVSPTRLSVHNLPIKCSDDELKAVFQIAVGEEPGNKDAKGMFKKSVVTECRIMRDMSRVNSEGVHRSKGFGFVEFSTNALAKKALAAVNNSATAFKNGQRPIVQFSIEDMRALKKKQERHEKAQADYKRRTSGSFNNKKPFKKEGYKADKEKKKIENKRFNQKPFEREKPIRNLNKIKENDKKFGDDFKNAEGKRSGRLQQKFKKKSQLKQ